ncbi:Beta-adrenergic receptor kinase 2 [Sparganum proliferum]
MSDLESVLADEGPEKQLLDFYEAILAFEQINTDDDRLSEARRRFVHTRAEVVQNSLNDGLKKKSVSRQLFSTYLCDLRSMLKESFYEPFLKSQHFTRYCQWIDVQLNTTLSMSDFSVHRIIGRGGFGEVYGCRKLNSGKMYAMKCLDKKRIKMKSGESMAINELNILSRVSSGDASPFIVCMTYAFQTPEKLCFILDLMNGGDLNYHLSQHGTFTEDEVQFYAAEVILGLEHMHERNIVYRDLKPANILLDERGHVRISDLGLACDVSEKWPTAAVGTYGYMAPEVMQKSVSYAFSADWYSLGCTIYKLLVGNCPFRQHGQRGRGNDGKSSSQQTLHIPDKFSEATKSFLTQLLQSQVETRLGCCGSGARELKSHPFLAHLDWELVKRQQLEPPVIPPQDEVNAADALEIGAFDEEDVQGIKLTKEDQAVYDSFDVVIADRWQHEMVTTIFDAVNEEFDQIEHKRRQKLQQKLKQLSQSIGGLSASPVHESEVDPADAGSSHFVSKYLSGTTNVGSQPNHQEAWERLQSSSNLQKTRPDNLATKQTSIDEDVIPSWPADLLLEWWIAPETYGCGPSDCLIESELLRLGGPFLHTWQKKHVRLFPNRLEIYHKTQQGIPLKGAESVSMLDIGSIYPSLQKVNKYENVVIIVLKDQSKIFFTSTDQIIIETWLCELLQAFQNSSQVLSTVSRKVYWIYGIDEPKLYARAAPSSTNETNANRATVSTAMDLNAKRKTFQRMHSFQTVLGQKHNSPPVPRADPTSSIGRRAIMKTINRTTVSQSQDME